MKTTKKEFKQQVQLHILESLNYDIVSTPKAALQQAVNSFESWYDRFQQKHQPNRQQAFSEWLMCLPSDLSVEFSNHGIHTTLKQWFENMGETYEERPAYKECDLYLHLIFREFNVLCTKNNVQF